MIELSSYATPPTFLRQQAIVRAQFFFPPRPMNAFEEKSATLINIPSSSP